MSTGTGKHPAPSRGQARYTRRDAAVDRVAGRMPGAPGKTDKPGKSDKTDQTGNKAGKTNQTSKVAHAGRADSIGKVGNVRTNATEVLLSGKFARAADRSSPSLRAPSRPPAEARPEPPTRPGRRFFAWGRANRRITVESRSPAVWIGEQLAKLARRLLVVGKVLAALVALVAVIAGGRLAAKHVVASPRFALRDVRVGPTVHVSRDEIVERSTVVLGDRLLALDTDVIAARLTRHPWIASARVRRELPSTLTIDILERKAAAVAVIGGLYLLDEQGHPFKHATLDEADGQIVLTGISRPEYAGLPRASEAAFREALALFNEYQHPDSLAAARHRGTGGARPPLSEIHIDPRAGFSLILYDSGAEIRLGRGGLTDKLARLDEILAEFGPRGLSSVRVIHLDGPAGDRVPIRLAPPPPEEAPPPKSAKDRNALTPTDARGRPGRE